MINLNIRKIRNRPRNQRSFFLLSLFSDLLVGAAVHYKAGSPAALILSASVKPNVTVVLFFNPSEPIVDSDDFVLA
jgi:bloom syndrome protein